MANKEVKQLIEAALFAFNKPMTVKMLRDSVLSPSNYQRTISTQFSLS